MHRRAGLECPPVGVTPLVAEHVVVDAPHHRRRQRLGPRPVPAHPDGPIDVVDRFEALLQHIVVDEAHDGGAGQRQQVVQAPRLMVRGVQPEDSVARWRRRRARETR